MAAVPADIRSVPRPAHTEVVDTGLNSFRRFSVRQRLSATDRLNNPNTKYGKIVGYIYNNKFIDKISTTPADDYPYMVSYGAASLAISVAQDTFLRLKEFFPLALALQILVLSMIRLVHPSATMRTIKTFYDTSYFSVAFPCVPLSKNSISELYENIGNSNEAIRNYRGSLLKDINEDEVIIVDGTHREDTSIINNLSARSYKNIEEKSPVLLVMTAALNEDSGACFSDLYPGSFSDASFFKQFLIKNNIFQGILVGDKAFYPSIVRDVKSTQSLEKLHYILPLKKQRFENRCTWFT